MSISNTSNTQDSLKLSEEGLEPQVTSMDPSERKMARKLRIQRRREAIERSKLSAEETRLTEELETQNPIQIQLQKSADILEKFIKDSEEYITNVKVALQSREVARRENEELNRNKFIGELETEAASANEAFDTIASKWSSIQNYNDPLYINEQIVEQKKNCDLLIAQKDEIIAMLNNELKKAEQQFTNDQKKQMEDINILTQRINNQITFMRRAYRDELNILEGVVLQERQILIDSSDKKWEDLQKKCQEQEILNSEQKLLQVEEFNKKMDYLRIDFQERYRATKINMENNIDELQREFEKIKALTMLNSEKMDYNYQLLKKREDENLIIKSQQKRRMNKLQDIINILRKRIADYESDSTNKIKKLQESIKKLHKLILDVETKSDHFARVNDEKFHQVWEMNKKHIQEVLQKILDTDKILYEQQLGLDWKKPAVPFPDKRSMPSYKTALFKVDPELITDTTDKKLATSRQRLSIKASPSEPLKEKQILENQSNPYYRKLLYHILTRISDKSGFLTENRLKSLLKEYEDDQKNLVRIDNVFEALGIQSTDCIDVLFKHFQPYIYCPICHGSVSSSPNFTDSKQGSVSSHLFLSEKDEDEIPELIKMKEAIRQPDDVFDSIVTDLVKSGDFEEIEDSQIKPLEGIQDICDLNEDVNKSKSSKKFKSGSHQQSVVKIFTEPLQCHYRHPLCISTVYVLRALREFVASYYVKKPGAPTSVARMANKRLTISRLLSKEDIKNYWEQIKQIFDDDRIETWNALYAGLQKYHNILRERKATYDRIVQYRKENSDLKNLLKNYLRDGDLLPPPCAKDNLGQWIKDKRN